MNHIRFRFSDYNTWKPNLLSRTIDALKSEIYSGIIKTRGLGDTLFNFILSGPQDNGNLRL